MEPIDKLVVPKNDEEKENLVTLAVNSTCEADDSVIKLLTPNDTRDFKRHGVHISIDALSVLFPLESEPHRYNVEIDWFFKNDENIEKITTKDTSFHHYCHYKIASKRECRISRVPFDKMIKKNVEDFNSKLIGSLFILLRKEKCYQAFILDDAEDIKQYLGVFGLSSVQSSHVIKADAEMDEFVKKLLRKLGKDEFPDTNTMAFAAREMYKTCPSKRRKYEGKLLNWIRIEYEIFKAIEEKRYKDKIEEIKKISKFIFIANKILNRRKSRAGKSLEHHLKEIFDENKIACVEQLCTEKGHKPDFIFPNEEAYRDGNFPQEGLVFLAAKTTCKDRWRQILDEAQRFEKKEKFLFTLQPGVSKTQMEQMKSSHVILVVPGWIRQKYYEGYENDVLTLKEFINYVKEIQKCYEKYKKNALTLEEFVDHFKKMQETYLHK